MHLIVIAHPLEAIRVLEALKAKEVEPGRLWHFEGGAVLVTGMGSTAAAAGVGRYAHGFSHIYNVGFAGSLGGHEMGEVLEVGECTKHIPLPTDAPGHCEKLAKKAHPSLSIGSGVHLLTSDYPIHSQEERQSLQEYDVVDMEGYGVAVAAKRASLPCTMWKVISDSCQGKGWETIASHLEELQERVANLVTELGPPPPGRRLRQQTTLA